MRRGTTPSQTVGPFFHVGLDRPGTGNLLEESAPGAIRIEGCVLDGNGDPVSDALLEIWQCDAAGRYPHPEDGEHAQCAPGFRGFGRAATDDEGRFRFVTVKPGRVAGRGNRLQAPHVNVILFARGLLNHLYTRVYFADETAANGEDPLLGSIDDERARATLLARPAKEEGSIPAYRFDIRLQGDDETVFLQP